MDSPRSLGLKIVVRRMSYSSSSVQVLKMDLGSKGAPIEHSVMDQMMEMAASNPSLRGSVIFLACKVLRMCVLYVKVTVYLHY